MQCKHLAGLAGIAGDTIRLEQLLLRRRDDLAVERGVARGIGVAADRLRHVGPQLRAPYPIGRRAQDARRRLVIGLDRIDRAPVAEIEPAIVAPDMIGVAARDRGNPAFPRSPIPRSEVRRGGKECARTCMSRWSSYRKKKKKT